MIEDDVDERVRKVEEYWLQKWQEAYEQRQKAKEREASLERHRRAAMKEAERRKKKKEEEEKDRTPN